MNSQEWSVSAGGFYVPYIFYRYKIQAGFFEILKQFFPEYDLSILCYGTEEIKFYEMAKMYQEIKR